MKKMLPLAAAVLLPVLALAGRSFDGADSEKSGPVLAAQAGAYDSRQAPDGNAPKASFAFAVIGDSGTGHKAQYEVARQMKLEHDKVPFDTVIMCGDNIYPDGNSVWFRAKFEVPYQDLLADGVRFYASLGNHDAEHGQRAELEYDKFGMGGHRYYAFSKGNGLVEFFALDTNQISPEQTKWLEESLAASKARWKVVFGHHPLYCSARKHGSSPELCTVLEPLFVKYKVDSVFSGHDHVYERVKPQNGIHYFTEGASGQLRKGNLDRSDPIFDAGDDRNNSFVLVQVTGSQMTIRAIAADGTILDKAVIEKKQ
jgi:hypothetical protein